MTHQPLPDPERCDPFSNYFELGLTADDLVAELGYTFERKFLTLPQYSDDLNRIADLKQRIEEILPYLDLENEAIRREMLIAPIISDLIRHSRAKLRIEYSIRVDNRLQVKLDYLLRSTHNLIVVEAKQADMRRGFAQLAAEMIALDQWTDSPQTEILGAVTTGNIWQFCVLDRRSKSICEGVNLYRLTEELEMIIRILLARLV